MSPVIIFLCWNMKRGGFWTVGLPEDVEVNCVDLRDEWPLSDLFTCVQPLPFFFFFSLFWEGSPLPSALMFTNILFYIFLFFNCTICLVVRMRPAWEDLMLCYAFSFPVESRWCAFLFWQGPEMIDYE
jgi:hypothetical protein